MNDTQYRKEYAHSSCAAPRYSGGNKSCELSVARAKPFSELYFPPFTYYNAPSPSKVLQQALLASGISYGVHAASTAYYGIISGTLAHSADTSLYTPALACFCLWRGRQDENASMIDAAHQLYLHGLVSTQQALAGNKTAHADSTLAACHALGLYEALECPDNTAIAYMWHRAACVRLVRLRGPEAHREGLGHELFVNVRIFAVCI